MSYQTGIPLFSDRFHRVCHHFRI